MLTFNNYTYVYELFLILISLFFIVKNKNLKKIFIAFIIILLIFYRSYDSSFFINNSFLSPSQCKISNIDIIDNNTVFSTYLSPFNLHYMITPIDSTIVNIERNPDDNEADKLTITFETFINGVKFQYQLQQIVNKLGNWGYLPSIIYKHRCITWKNIGDNLKQGDKYGLIRFGSMMKFIIPSDMIKKINVKKSQKIEIGQSLFFIE